MENECQRIEELLAAFALGALEIDEAIEVEAHVQSCAACREVLRDYQAVSDDLMTAMPPVMPPASVRAKLLARTAPPSQKPGASGRWRALLPHLIPVAAVVGVLVLLIININLLRQTSQMAQAQEQMAQQNQTYQTAFALLTYPGSEVAVIDDGNIYGTLIYDPDGKVAVLNVWGLDELPEGQDYQVWLIEADETRISGGVFQASDELGYSSFVIESPNSLETFVGIGVTIEPEGGSPGPTGPRVFGTGL